MRVRAEAPITYEVAGGARVHCPVVEASVGSERTRLILDTGASAHVLTIELAHRAGLRAEPGEPGLDRAGASVPSWTIGDVGVRIGDEEIGLRAVAAMEAPARFEGWGIGGFLSPLALHPTGWVVLDLAAGALALVEGDSEAVVDWLRARSPALRLLTLAREPFDTVVVRAALEPYAEVPTMLDTGAGGSEFERTAVPGLRGTATEGAGFSASGAGIDGEEVRERTLLVGGARLPLGSVVVRESSPPPPGLVGMDVLAGTVVAVCAVEGAPLLWLVPPAPSG